MLHVTDIFYKADTDIAKAPIFLIFLLKILKDCDNVMLLGTRSHIFGSRNEMDSVS